MNLESFVARHQNNAARYHKILQETGVVEIKGFLPEAEALHLASFLYERMPLDWWYASTRAGSKSRPHDVRVLPRSGCDMGLSYAAAADAFRRGEFSYSFLRTKGHVGSCSCELCALVSVLSEAASLELIHSVSGSPSVTRVAELFASRYRPGDFLSPHADASRGRRIAIVVQLTRDWRPEYGGLLHFTSAGGSQVDRVICPRFNSACIFAIPPSGSSMHFVSHVAPGAPCDRIAVSGWYA